MSVDWDGVTHVTKVDPAKPLPPDPGILEATDLIIVGGSDGVTEDNVLETIRAVADAAPSVPIVQEPSSGAHVSLETVRATDALAVPAVFNGDREHFVGKHLELFAEIERRSDELSGVDHSSDGGSPTREQVVDLTAELASNLIAEGYVIQHLESTAAHVSGVERPFSLEEVAGAALATETFYNFPVFYVEYSGTYGGPEDVAAAARYLEETTLCYGGGIDDREQVAEILAAGADAVVVGDCFHADPEPYLETIP